MVKQLNSMVLDDQNYVEAQRLKVELGCRSWSELFLALVNHYHATTDLIEKEGEVGSIPQKKADLDGIVDGKLNPIKEKLNKLNGELTHHSHELPILPLENEDYERRFKKISYLFDEIFKVLDKADLCELCNDDRKALNIVKNGS